MTPAQNDAVFRESLPEESVECFLSGDVETGCAILRDYINATVGFDGLAKEGIHLKVHADRNTP